MDSLIAFEIRNGKYDNNLDEVIRAATERRKELQELEVHYEKQVKLYLEYHG